MGRVTHYDSIGRRINKRQFTHLALNPAYKFDGKKITMGTGTVIAYRHEAKDSERDIVIKEGRY